MHLVGWEDTRWKVFNGSSAVHELLKTAYLLMGGGCRPLLLERTEIVVRVSTENGLNFRINVFPVGEEINLNLNKWGLGNTRKSVGINQVSCHLSDCWLAGLDPYTKSVVAELTLVVPWVVRGELLFVNRFENRQRLTWFDTTHQVCATCSVIRQSRSYSCFNACV